MNIIHTEQLLSYRESSFSGSELLVSYDWQFKLHPRNCFQKHIAFSFVDFWCFPLRSLGVAYIVRPHLDHWKLALQAVTSLLQELTVYKYKLIYHFLYHPSLLEDHIVQQRTILRIWQTNGDAIAVSGQEPMHYVGQQYTVNVEIFVLTIIRGLNFRGDKFLWVRVAHHNYCC